MVSGRTAGGGAVALRRHAAGADAAADRRQLRDPARADGRVPAPPVRARQPRARHAAADRRAGRRAGRAVRLHPAGRGGGLLARHLRAQSLSRRAHRARLRTARPRLAGPAVARLSAGLSAAAGRWRWPPPSRRACSASPASGCRGALLLAYLLRRPRPDALHRPRPRAAGSSGSSMPAVLFIEPYTAVAADAGRAARARPQAEATLRRSSLHRPEPSTTGQRSQPHAGHSSGAHRPPRPDGRRRQRQGRLRPQLPAAAEEGAARHRGEPRPLREGPARPARGARPRAEEGGRGRRRQARGQDLPRHPPGRRHRPALRLGHLARSSPR